MKPRRVCPFAIALLLCVAALSQLASCSHVPIISNANEVQGNARLGEVASISELLGQDARAATIVFIHGVGDHCPGYALDPDYGWLNRQIATQIGLRAVEGTLKEPIFVSDSDFVPGKKTTDKTSRVSYRTADFEYNGIPIHAVEITWSELTQWIKTQQLDYDSTVPLPKAQDRRSDCFYTLPSDPEKFPRSSAPPPRAYVNRMLKEQVLNRSLADTLIYVGDRGPAIQRGVAEALCLALGGVKYPIGSHGEGQGHMCEWPSAKREGQRADEARKYFFVTHSLGSRILYDTLLGLTGDIVNPNRPTFSATGPANEVEGARAYVCHMIAQTAAVYMMANQLPVLGLAYDDPKRGSEAGATRLDVEEGLPLRGCGAGSTPDEVASSSEPVDRSIMLDHFEQMWERAREEELLSQDAKLTIVAFTDTNDLLSWPIPKWYLKNDEGKQLPMTITNVYVRNTTPWFGFLAWPDAAHVDYLSRKEVWDVIVKGARKGKVCPCE